MPQTNKILIPYLVFNVTILGFTTLLGLAVLNKGGLVNLQIGPYLIHVESQSSN